ncbi:MAG: hypothetical protein Q8Q08_01135 [Candidatus Omnitrophota bacterium]|nr:hypothetical protein [Candidatus Omnitrophota bacterium]MDZ4241278.1 hypothetical protein [Candidatus Omnitrophota bacterium]
MAVTVLAAVFIVFCFLFIFCHYVHFNMDEFLQYHALACHYYPHNQLNVFRESCREYELAIVPGQYWPLRSYFYVGSFPGLLYFPLFKLWPSPYSARLLGLLFLTAQAFLLTRLFRTRFLLNLCLLLVFFPYAFQHMAETGPVSFQITSVFLICYLIKKWTSAAGREDMLWRYPLSIGLVLFLGIWIKLAYFFVLPGILLLIIYFIFDRRKALFSPHCRKKFFLQSAVSGLLAALPSWMLLNAKDYRGDPYYAEMQRYAARSPFDLDGVSTHFRARILPYFSDPIKAAHYLFETPERSWSPEGMILIASILALLICGCVCLIKSNKRMTFALLNILLFLLTVFALSLSSQTWAMHHVVLSFPFLLLALFEMAVNIPRKAIVIAILAVFLFVNGKLYSQLPQLPAQTFDHASLWKFNQFLNEKFDDRYAFVTMDWGMYYLKALYGRKDQCALFFYIEHLMENPGQLREVLRKSKRKAVFILCTKAQASYHLSRKLVYNLPMAEPGFDAGYWRAWYEE